MKQKVIIDTDFGGDPDDILALLYALKSPELEISAIVTSDEYKINHRAKAVRRWLHIQKKSIPVFAGVDLGNTNLFLLDTYTKHLSTPPFFLRSSAFINLLTQVNKTGGFYVSIGGLTNLAMLLPLHKKRMKNIRYVIMAGTVKKVLDGKGEHNARLNAKATNTLLSAGLDTRWVLADHTSVPETKVSPHHDLYSVIAAKKSQDYRMIQDNLDAFYKTKYPESYVHDPITVATLFLPIAKFTSQTLKCTPAGFFEKTAGTHKSKMTQAIFYAPFWKDFLHKINS